MTVRQSAPWRAPASRTRLATTLLLLAACAQARPPAAPAPSSAGTAPTTSHAPRVPIDTLSIRADTRVLAHDSLGGRGTGSAGVRLAAHYIADRLRELGARPLASADARSTDPFLLPVPLRQADVAGSSLIVSAAGVERTLDHGDGFIVGRVGRLGLRAAHGPVALPGTDSAAVPAGAWLLLDAALGEAAVRWMPRWRAAGVAGVIVQLDSDALLEAYSGHLGPVRWQLTEGEPDAVWQPALPILLVGSTLGDALRTAGARVTFRPAVPVDTMVAYNVAGYIEGADPALAHEFVVLTAHYDHLGVVSGEGGGDTIYNGFSDNAAGVAMLLAIAEHAARTPPPRSLLLLFPTAEEVGLLGSLHFARSRPDIVGRMHALVNLDAGAPPARPTRWRLAAGTRSWAGRVAARVVEAHGWTHRSDPGSPNSDHWPFLQHGIPSVFLIPDGAYEGVDDAGAERLRRRWDRYHQPDDEWSPAFPFAGLGRYATLARDIAYALAATDGAL